MASVTSFRQFLQEDTTGKLTHLTHLEDLILDAGSAGVASAVEILREFGVMLENGGVSQSLNVTVKWDGAPSIVFGLDPTDGRFFVATKSAFSKTPKLMKTQQQIHDTYGDSGVANKLHTCFAELQTLRPKQIFQGDLLFTDDVKTQTLDGKSYATFRPNTILYAVDAQSALGQAVRRARLGIVVHTMYTGSGDSISKYHSAPVSSSAFASLQQSGNVLVMDASFDDVSGTATFTQGEAHDYALMLHRIESASSHIPAAVYDAVTQVPLHDLLARFFNQRTRTGAEVPGSAAELTEFLMSDRDAEVQKRTSPRGKDAVTEKYDGIIRSVSSHTAGFNAWFKLHADISRAKVFVVRKLARVSQVQSFIPTASGFELSGPEGFVAVSHSGRAVKLVDRLVFSRANFLAAKEWA